MVFSLNYVVYYNLDIWGSNYNEFDFLWFFGEEGEKFKCFFSFFSIGYWMCIGKNMVMINMLKLVLIIIKYYELMMEDLE